MGFNKRKEAWAQAGDRSSRLAEFGGLGMSLKICRGTLGSLAMFTAIRNPAWGAAESGPPCRYRSSTWRHRGVKNGGVDGLRAGRLMIAGAQRQQALSVQCTSKGDCKDCFTELAFYDDRKARLVKVSGRFEFSNDGMGVISGIGVAGK
jgi:hypothetical protein